MPRVISYTPSWLSRPNPGFQLFSSTPSTLSPARTKGRSPHHPINTRADGTRSVEGPRKVIARRGTEIFVVADNQIRWSDLCMLKNDWEEKEHNRKYGRSKAEASSKAELQDDGGVGSINSYRVYIPSTKWCSIAKLLLGSRGPLQ